MMENKSGPTEKRFLSRSIADLICIYDQKAAHYGKGRWFDKYVLGALYLRRQLLRKARGRILDVACGAGEAMKFLPEGSNITAIDISSSMLAETRILAHQQGKDVETLLMDSGNLGFNDYSFDTVISALSTCIFPDPISALKEMKRVCKAEGQILLLEHGRSSFEPIGRYQDRITPIRMQRSGCRENQEPQEVVKAAGLTILSAKRGLLGFFHAIEVSP
jgi:ubiquinone/menaquinone biosynthesis C-methylase UbiE